METNISNVSNFTPHIIIENCPITKHNTLIVNILNLIFRLASQD